MSYNLRDGGIPGWRLKGPAGEYRKLKKLLAEQMPGVSKPHEALARNA